LRRCVEKKSRGSREQDASCVLPEGGALNPLIQQAAKTEPKRTRNNL